MATASVMPSVQQSAGHRWAQPRVPDRAQNVSVYAGHSTQPGDGYYEHAEQVGQALAQAGLGVVTGGGCGSMEAAAAGACKAGGHTIGMAMPFIGEETNRNVFREHYEFSNFSDRLDKGFERRAALNASVPGGIGTLMELTKKATEISTDKSLLPTQKQIVLFDRNNIFQNWVRFLDDNLVKNGLMSKEALNVFKVVDENNVQAGVRLLQGQNVVDSNGRFLQSENRFTRGLNG